MLQQGFTEQRRALARLPRHPEPRRIALQPYAGRVVLSVVADRRLEGQAISLPAGQIVVRELRAVQRRTGELTQAETIEVTRRVEIRTGQLQRVRVLRAGRRLRLEVANRRQGADAAVAHVDADLPFLAERTRQRHQALLCFGRSRECIVLYLTETLGLQQRTQRRDAAGVADQGIAHLQRGCAPLVGEKRQRRLARRLDRALQRQRVDLRELGVVVDQRVQRGLLTEYPQFAADRFAINNAFGPLLDKVDTCTEMVEQAAAIENSGTQALRWRTHELISRHAAHRTELQFGRERIAGRGAIKEPQQAAAHRGLTAEAQVQIAAQIVIVDIRSRQHALTVR